MKRYLGVDLGGTNIRAALVSDQGQILEEKTISTRVDQSADTILKDLVDLIQSLKDYKTALAIGIGVPGPVDQAKGSMAMCTNIPPLKDYPIVKNLENIFKISVFMDNDANVAGLAEARLGAGKGKDIVVYITHSTGIGGGIVIHGQTISGRLGYAGEIANIVVDRTKPSHNHLADGAVENLASGTAMVHKAQEMLDPSITSAKEVFDLKKAGNPKAIDLVDEMAKNFAQMCQAIAHVLDPDCFVIGGGVHKSKDLYMDQVVSYYKKMVHTQMADVPFYSAELSEPGLVGAAMLPASKGI